METHKLWKDFKNCYVERLKKADFASIFNNNYSKPSRTQLNISTLEGVAKDLDYQLEREFSSIDFALSKKATNSGYWVPKIFIEHENDIDSEPPNHEISKLCSTSAPLKVFISWWHCGADNGNGKWEDKRKEYVDGWWSYMVNSVMEVEGSLHGTLALIIIEVYLNNSKSFRYHAYIWNEMEKQFEKDLNEGIIFEITIT